MVTIIPAILATNEEEYKNNLSKVEKSGIFKGGWIQLDLMDSKFVQNESVKPEIIGKYSTNLKREAHLMVRYPENWIDELVEVKVERIIFPIEDTGGTLECIEHIKNHGIEVGLSLNPDTPVQKVQPFVAKINTVLIMSVYPGEQGQEFIPETLEKVKECFRLRSNNNLDFVIGIDGGITAENAKLVVDAGADYLVVGSHLIEGNIDENLEKFWEVLQT